MQKKSSEVASLDFFNYLKNFFNIALHIVHTTVNV